MALVTACLAASRVVAASDEGVDETVSTLRVDHGGQRTIAILSDNLPGVDTALVRTLVTQLQQDGFAVQELSASQVCDTSVLSPARYFLYVIPQCRTYPAAGLGALTAFVSQRGHVLFLGGPFLDDPLWQRADSWLNREEVSRIKRQAESTHAPFDLKVLAATDWMRTTSHRDNPGTWEIVPEGPDGTLCFRFTSENLQGWDGYLSQPLDNLFGPQHDLFTFVAKGGPRTSQLAVEMQEKDGSRWIAVTPLTSQWQRIALEPGDFKYWSDSSTRTQRGGAGDRFQPAQAVRINFQLAQSHTTALPPGEHAFWIADIGTCVNPVAGMELTVAGSDTSFETIFPRYKVFTLADEMKVQTAPFAPAGVEVFAPSASDLVCAVPRTMGRGFQREQKWRYVPLADATDSAGRWRGSPAWLVLHHAPPYAGSAFAALGWNNSEQLASAPILRAASQIALRLRDGLFLQEAGSEQFSYWPGEPVKLGASVSNLGSVNRTVTVRIRVTDQTPIPLLQESTRLELPAGESKAWRSTATLPAPASNVPLRITTELLVDDRVIDRIAHTASLLRQDVPADEAFMSVRGNDFYVHGAKWYPVGVNYWPLYVSGMDHDDYWAGWITGRFYDPELVEEDLRRMRELGINMVSIQSHDPEHYRNLLDFVARCGRHDIYVNLFCGLASPLGFRERELREFVTTARLADNPVIMAYDTIWEPGNHVFSSDWRPRWDGDWQAWLVEQYGSVEAAEEDWQFKCPRTAEGQPTSPPDNYFREDGPWRVLMAAYRRFMDDLMSRKWNQTHRRLREIDPRHLISFRQGNTLPHDFTFTATVRHIDFICPEGYAIPHSEEGYLTAGFISKFVHFTTRGKPIVWSEFGQSVWDAQAMEPSASRIEAVADYHELFYRMVLETGANGTVPWWWPGGYRVGELSDYGIVNRDGTARPAAELIRRYAPRLKAPRIWPEPTTWFDIDCDSHAGGYWFVCFHTGQEAQRQALAAGRHLGVRSAGTGTTSADTPWVAVGNRPCTGANPPRFLNAEFNGLSVLDASGNWAEARDGAEIRVAKDAPVRARVNVGNTQEATWLAPPKTSQPRSGDVLLGTTEGSRLRGSWRLPQDTLYLGDADFGEIVLAAQVTEPVLVELRMEAYQRGGFGEKRTFQLLPP